jgi:hypothetical protein
VRPINKFFILLPGDAFFFNDTSALTRRRFRPSSTTTEFFIDQKAKHPARHEKQELEDLVKSGVPLAVRVEDVSLL